jgi:hypothetical protein
VAWFGARGLVAADMVEPMTNLAIDLIVGVVLLGAMIWSFAVNSKTARIASVADMPEVKKLVASAEIAQGALKDHEKVVEK